MTGKVGGRRYFYVCLEVIVCKIGFSIVNNFKKKKMLQKKLNR